MSPPRISVLIPCFNDGAWVDEAVGSVLSQTYQDFEIVVVDDGSTDLETVRKLDGLRAPRTQVLRTSNRGLPAARNHAARHARGALFCALDADDRLAPEWFAKAVAVLDRRPDLAFVSHWLETFGDEHWQWTPGSCDLPALLARNTVNGAALVRREAFESVGGYDEAMREGCEDWDLWLRLVERGFAGIIVPEVLFHYRRRRESMSRAMIAEAAYRRPLETLIAKHEGAYRASFVEVLVAKEAESLALAREIAALEHDRITVLEPSLARAREELAAVEAKAAKVDDRRRRREALDRLSWEVSELRREVSALRASWSWRVTAPLRAVYGWIVAGRGRQ